MGASPMNKDQKEGIHNVLIGAMKGFVNLAGAHETAFLHRPRLLFPLYHGSHKSIRVSEREMHHLVSHQFEIRKSLPKLFYSVEVPTWKAFRFSGLKYEHFAPRSEGRSALIDFAVFDEQGNAVQIANIEFKHGNARISDYAKDIVKLVSDDCPGYLVNTLESCDRGTFHKSTYHPGILTKVAQALQAFKRYQSETPVLYLYFLAKQARSVFWVELDGRVAFKRFIKIYTQFSSQGLSLEELLREYPHDFFPER